MIGDKYRPAVFQIVQWRKERVAAFISDDRGYGVIEFAIVSVPFLGLLLGIFGIGEQYLRLAQLQNAADTAARMIMTSTATGAMSHGDFIKNYVCTWKSKGTVDPGTLSRMFDCDTVYALVDRIYSYSNPVAIPNPATLSYSVAWAIQPGQVGFVRVYYPASRLSIFGSLAPTYLAEGKFVPLLSAVAVFRVEAQF
jgi:hypothetical protein